MSTVTRAGSFTVTTYLINLLGLKLLPVTRTYTATVTVKG